MNVVRIKTAPKRIYEAPVMEVPRGHSISYLRSIFFVSCGGMLNNQSIALSLV